jgi:hypothetical protein
VRSALGPDLWTLVLFIGGAWAFTQYLWDTWCWWLKWRNMTWWIAVDRFVL